MAAKSVAFSKKQLPKDGLEIALTKGNTLTRIHLDMSKEGVVLSMVGTATATALASSDTRQLVKLLPSKEGISLAMVGTANSVIKK